MQPLVVRLGSRKLKKLHPGEVEEGEVIWRSNCGKNFRVETAKNNPAKFAYYFNFMCKAVLKHLFGLNLDRKKEVFLEDAEPGIFGSIFKTREGHGVTEAQARNALHLHVNLWLSHGPLWFSRFIHDEKF